MTSMQRAIGRLIMVQESRFRLATAGGQTLLFGLAHDSGVDELQLLDLYRNNTRVAVDFLGEPGLETGIAHKISPLL